VRSVRRQGTITNSRRDRNTFHLVTDPREKEIYEMPEKEFELMVLRKPSKAQENADN
jgi:hypothetical protein